MRRGRNVVSVLRVTDRPPSWDDRCRSFGRLYALKQAGGPAEDGPSYGLAGPLYHAQDGCLALGVPNAFVRGVFSALREPGVELPPGRPGGRFDARVVVMTPDELRQVGGPDRVSERGRSFAYSLGRLYSAAPADWPGVARVWYVKVYSPELQRLRLSYGLPPLPRPDADSFRLVVAVRRRGVLGRNATAKTGPPLDPGLPASF